MTKTRRQHRIRLTVSAPVGLTAREVRTLINGQCNFMWLVEEGDIKALSVRPAKRNEKGPESL